MVIGEILAYVEALIACDLPPDELAARIKAKLPAAHTGTLDDLIGVAPPAKLPAVIATFLKGLAKVEKADAKRKRDRENVASFAQPRHGDIRDTRDIGDLATWRPLPSIYFPSRFRTQEGSEIYIDISAAYGFQTRAERHRSGEVRRLGSAENRPAVFPFLRSPPRQRYSQS
jgi:hypothetical protein